MYQTNISYGSIRDMDQEVAAASWKKFKVIVAGKTDGAHETIVKWLRVRGQTEVSSPEDGDYLLVFCPVASKVETDVGEALQNVPAGKPVILVVMHHTFDPDRIVEDSRRQVDNANVRLTVDCLFYEGRLLDSDRNNLSWSEIQKFLGLAGFSESSCQRITRVCEDLLTFAAVFVLIGFTIVLGFIGYQFYLR